MQSPTIIYLVGDSQNSSKRFSPDLDRARRVLNLVYLQNKKKLTGGGVDMDSKF
jgi:hypothetical protein